MLKLSAILVCLFSINAYALDLTLEEKAALIRSTCGNGHSGIISYGKVTTCDGKPFNGSIRPVVQEKIKWSFDCFTIGQYILCEDGFYQRVSPIVASQLLQNK
jgi:hypothetical protein